MIERLHRIALFLSPMKWPAFALSICMLLIVLLIVLSPNSATEEIYLVPSIVGLLFFFTLFVLVANFDEVPRKIESGDRFLLRIKIRMYRFWFTVLGLLFSLAAVVEVILAFSLLRVWMDE